ncbi:hypothetical protein ZIOFF_064442 [Zingiber officinale]|uniref:Uncharacterized protein n=1 Tax=Zingiber officinale TaxID=94328 RepID=A0A8J5EVY2_ZINOF|nr:hypothetical protein ZIOFF_064442 [Zingiber officinale]
MGISFKLSKIGKRYHPKPSFAPEEADQTSEGSEESSHVLDGAGSSREVRLSLLSYFYSLNCMAGGKISICVGEYYCLKFGSCWASIITVPSNSSSPVIRSDEVFHCISLLRVYPVYQIGIVEAANGINNLLPEHEVSFILNLYQDGYSIGKPTEIENCQTLLQDAKESPSLVETSFLAETLFLAVKISFAQRVLAALAASRHSSLPAARLRPLFQKDLARKDGLESYQTAFCGDAHRLAAKDEGWPCMTRNDAIESGWLPGDILDEIPCKYYRGTIVCEVSISSLNDIRVRDYRKCFSEQGSNVSAANVTPTVQKVRLRMSLENVIKDISLIADDSWTYSDLMEVEARIVKALNSHLYLDPTPKLERDWKDPIVTKLNLGIGRKKRMLQNAEVTASSNNQHPEKKIFIDRISDNSNCGAGETGSQIGNASLQQAYETIQMQHLSGGVPSMRSNNFGQESTKLTLPTQAKLQTVINSPTSSQDRGPGLAANISVMNANMSSSQNLIGSYPDTVNNSPRSKKRENPDAQLTSFIGMKRPKQTSVGVDSIQQQQQQTGSQLVGLTGTDLQWKNQMLHCHLDAKGGQYASTLGNQRYSSAVVNNIPSQDPGASFYFNHQGIRYVPKEEQLDGQEQERSKEALQALSVNSAVDQQQSRAQLPQQSYMRNHPPTPMQWQNVRSVPEKDMGKDDTSQRRKSVPSPRVSSGPMVQSPVSSRSGEISSGSAGGQFSGIATASALGVQKDKLIANSNATIGAPSVTSSPSDSLHRQHQTSGTAKRKPNSMTKTQTVSAVGSPVSVNNMNPPLTVNSPSIGTAPLGDQVVVDRFMKIDAITQRHQLNLKKNKVDDYPGKEPTRHSTQELAICLSDSSNAEDFTDQKKPLAKSVIGGTINTPKDRTISFVRNERAFQVSMRLIMTEKPFDGTVSMQYEYMDDSKVQDYQLTLPTTNLADLLAAQFVQLMEHDGYQKAEDQIRSIPVRMVASPGSLPSGTPMMTVTSTSGITSEMKPSEIASGQPSQVAFSVANAIGPMNSSQLPSNNARMMTAANNSQTLAVSQGYLAGTLMSARMQQRSSTLLSTNPLQQMISQNSNLQMGTNQMVNNKQLQLQILQQQQQQQLPRKMMMGLNPAMSMGNMGNNVMGLGNLNNVVGMGGMRAISSPIGTMSGLGNLSSHQMNLVSASNFSAGLPQNSFTHAQAVMASKLRMAQQNRAGLYGQSGITGMPGSSNQMLPSSPGLSMLGALNRANMNPLQRNPMSTMGPPKVPGANLYLNPQQQQQLQPQQQQQLQPPQQQQEQISSPLQQTQVGSPPMVGSPSAMLMQHQQISPQQMSQQNAMSPQQLSSGALQQMNNSVNPGPGPSSPQLSSQTHGSVGSITSSPMEQLQGATKAGSASNV